MTFYFADEAAEQEWRAFVNTPAGEAFLALLEDDEEEEEA